MKKVIFIILLVILLSIFAVPTSNAIYHPNRKHKIYVSITLQDVRQISSILAHEWAEKEDNYKFTIIYCWLKGRPGPYDPEAPPKDAGCEISIPTISYEGQHEHWVNWENGTIVTLHHNMLCAQWEGPTKGRVCHML